MSKVNALEQQADTGDLKGSVFRAKGFWKSDRKKGLLGLLGSKLCMDYMTYLTLTFGSIPSTVAATGGLIYFMSKLYEKDVIKQIDIITEGENAGKLSIKVARSPLWSWEEIIANPRDVYNKNEDNE